MRSIVAVLVICSAAVFVAGQTELDSNARSAQEAFDEECRRRCNAQLEIDNLAITDLQKNEVTLISDFYIFYSKTAKAQDSLVQLAAQKLNKSAISEIARELLQLQPFKETGENKTCEQISNILIEQAKLIKQKSKDFADKSKELADLKSAIVKEYTFLEEKQKTIIEKLSKIEKTPSCKDAKQILIVKEELYVNVTEIFNINVTIPYIHFLDGYFFYTKDFDIYLKNFTKQLENETNYVENCHEWRKLQIYLKNKKFCEEQLQEKESSFLSQMFITTKRLRTRVDEVTVESTRINNTILEIILEKNKTATSGEIQNRINDVPLQKPPSGVKPTCDEIKAIQKREISLAKIAVDNSKQDVDLQKSLIVNLNNSITELISTLELAESLETKADDVVYQLKRTCWDETYILINKFNKAHNLTAESRELITELYKRQFVLNRLAYDLGGVQKTLERQLKRYTENSTLHPICYPEQTPKDQVPTTISTINQICNEYNFQEKIDLVNNHRETLKAILSKYAELSTENSKISQRVRELSVIKQNDTTTKSVIVEITSQPFFQKVETVAYQNCWETQQLKTQINELVDAKLKLTKGEVDNLYARTIKLIEDMVPVADDRNALGMNLYYAKNYLDEVRHCQQAQVIVETIESLEKELENFEKENNALKSRNDQLVLDNFQLQSYEWEFESKVRKATEVRTNNCNHSCTPCIQAPGTCRAKKTKNPNCDENLIRTSEDAVASLEATLKLLKDFSKLSADQNSEISATVLKIIEEKQNKKIPNEIERRVNVLPFQDKKAKSCEDVKALQAKEIAALKAEYNTVQDVMDKLSLSYKNYAQNVRDAQSYQENAQMIVFKAQSALDKLNNTYCEDLVKQLEKFKKLEAETLDSDESTKELASKNTELFNYIKRVEFYQDDFKRYLREAELNLKPCIQDEVFPSERKLCKEELIKKKSVIINQIKDKVDKFKSEIDKLAGENAKLGKRVEKIIKEAPTPSKTSTTTNQHTVSKLSCDEVTLLNKEFKELESKLSSFGSDVNSLLSRNKNFVTYVNQVISIEASKPSSSSSSSNDKKKKKN